MKPPARYYVQQKTVNLNAKWKQNKQNMEYFWIACGALFIITGFIGSFLPVVPGPPIGYAGLLILQLTPDPPFSLTFLVVWACIVGGVMILENLIPAYGTKKWGGSPFGIWGSIAGALAGLFFAPVGLVLGPLAGAFLGELVAGKKSDRALKSAFGSFLGFLAGTLLKAVATGMMGYYFFTSI